MGILYIYCYKSLYRILLVKYITYNIWRNCYTKAGLKDIIRIDEETANEERTKQIGSKLSTLLD